MPAIGASLDHLQLLSARPERLVDFYHGVMGMRAEQIERDVWACTASERRVLVARGPSPALGLRIGILSDLLIA